MRPAAIIATPIALLAAFYLIAGHFWYALGIVAAMVTCASLAVAIQRGALLDDRDEELARTLRELDAERTVRRQTEHAFAEFQVAVADGKVRRGRLHVVPEQREPVDLWPWLDDALDEQAETWPTDGGA